MLHGALVPASLLCRFAKFRFGLIFRLLLRSRFYRRFCCELQSQTDSSGSVLCCDRLPYFQFDCFVLRLHLVVLFFVIGGNVMPQYGPFVEVFCETYVHHSVLNILVVGMSLVAVLGMVTVGLIVHRFTKKA